MVTKKIRLSTPRSVRVLKMEVPGKNIGSYKQENGEIHQLPVLVLMPHSACNCRCVMCDIWKANANKTTLDTNVIKALLPDLKRLGVREVVLSGGEALMHPNLWSLCKLLKETDCKISLLSTGLLVTKYASEIIEHCDRLIVSLDGDRDTHNSIRNIPNAFEKLSEGIAAIQSLNPAFPVSARSVILKENYSQLSATIDAAKSVGLDNISFLTADVDTQAFNREGGWQEDRKNEIALTTNEIKEFESTVDHVICSHADDFKSRFIVESPNKFRRFIKYFKALNGEESFPTVTCNAPWTSAVIEANGDIRPCFFHASYGNLDEGVFLDILNSPDAVKFRKNLDVAEDSICQGCVCTLNYK